MIALTESPEWLVTINTFCQATQSPSFDLSPERSELVGQMLMLSFLVFKSSLCSHRGPPPSSDLTTISEIDNLSTTSSVFTRARNNTSDEESLVRWVWRGRSPPGPDWGRWCRLWRWDEACPAGKIDREMFLSPGHRPDPTISSQPRQTSNEIKMFFLIDLLARAVVNMESKIPRSPQIRQWQSSHQCLPLPVWDGFFLLTSN